jgi:hypothetical protein
MTGDAVSGPVMRVRDGRTWQIGTAGEVAWITSGTRVDRTITSGIRPIFAAYATIVLPNPEEGVDRPEHETEWTQYIIEWDRTAPLRHERALLEVLLEHSGDQSWWLGYLDTGAADTVFPDAPMVFVYHSSWRYVLVSAGPEQAAGWRKRGWKLAIPDLIFPADRSWLLSTLWDDDWTCIGRPEGLVTSLLSHSLLGARTRRVNADEDATPPGHVPH